MIITVKLVMTIARPEKPDFLPTDPRILLAAQRVLLARPGVLSADLLPWQRRFPAPDPDMVFVVALEDQDPDGDGEWIPVTTLVSDLVDTEKIRIVWAQDGGWKVQLVDIDFRVTD